MDPEENEIEVKKLDSETQAEINDEIDTAWVQLKEKHLDEKEQEKVDAFWSEACLADEFLSQLPPEMHYTKQEEIASNDGEVGNDVFYPKVEEEEDIPCTQQTKVNDDISYNEADSTKDFSQNPILISSSSTLSSEEDPATLTNSTISNHIPIVKVSRHIEISDMPPDLPSSLPYGRKRKQHDSQSSAVNKSHKRGDLSPVISPKIADDSSSPLHASETKQTSEDDWDSDFEEELDYAFLDEISNSM